MLRQPEEIETLETQLGGSPVKKPLSTQKHQRLFGEKDVNGRVNSLHCGHAHEKALLQ